MLTKAMMGIIETHTIGYVATVRPDGSPAVSPKGPFLVLNEREIAFSTIRSPGTVENLRTRADIEANFVDVFQRKGCRVRGLGRFVPMAEVERLLQVLRPAAQSEHRSVTRVTVRHSSQR